MEHLPPLKGGGLEEGSLDRSTLKSSQSLRKEAQASQASKKLQEITEKLNAIRLQRSALKKYDDGRIYGPKTDYSTVPKKLFSHPNLEYVYGEIMYSPYLTNPKDKYPKAVYTMSETLKNLKQKGVHFKDLPENERPYDDAQLKRAFIREVCNYNPKFNVPKMKKGDTGSLTTNSLTRASTASSSALGRGTTATSVSSSASKRNVKEFQAATSSGSPSRTSSVKKSNSPTSGRNVGSSGSSRSKKLNGLKPRRHASSSSMSKSLDASNFVPSTLDHTYSFKMTDVTKSAPSESMRYEKDGFTEPEEEEYIDDFADSSVPVKKDSAAERVEEEDNYEQDFEVTVIIVPQMEALGAEQESTTDAYNEDFEPEIVKADCASPPPSEKDTTLNSATMPTEVDSYADDFTAPENDCAPTEDVPVEFSIVKGASESSSIDESECVNNGSNDPPACAPADDMALIAVAEGSNDAYTDDFDEPALLETTVPLVSLSADTYDNNISSKHNYTSNYDAISNTPTTANVSAKVDPNSVKLRTDLVPGVSNSNNNSTKNNVQHSSNDANATTIAHSDLESSAHAPLQHENTAQSVLSDQSNASIKEDFDHTHTFSPPAPSTVRSDISIPNAHIGLSKQNSYDSSLHHEIAENLAERKENNADAAMSEVNTEQNTPKGEHTASHEFPGHTAENVDAGGVDGSSGVLCEGIASAAIETADDNIEIIEDTPVANSETADLSTAGAGATTIDTSCETLQDDNAIATQSTHLRDSPLVFPASERLVDSTYSPIPTEHIDIIPYTEQENTSVKENVTVNDNFLHSPVKSNGVSDEEVAEIDPAVDNGIALNEEDYDIEG